MMRQFLRLWEIKTMSNYNLPTLDEVEKDFIVKTLTFYEGHRASAAKSLDIGERTL